MDAAEQSSMQSSTQSTEQNDFTSSHGGSSSLHGGSSSLHDGASSAQSDSSTILERELAGQAEAMCSAMFHTGRMTVGRLFDIHDNGQIYLNSVVYQGPDSVGAVRKGDAATASSAAETFAGSSAASEASAGSAVSEASAGSSAAETFAGSSAVSETSAGSVVSEASAPEALEFSSSASEASVSSSAAFSEQSLSPGDRYIRSILLALLDAKDGQGKRLMKEQVQWYAVYKVLSEKLGYPSMMTEFVRSMEQLGMDRVSPCISFESIKKVPRTIDPLMKSVDCWPEYLCKAGGAVQKQILVAVKLLSLLRIA